MRPLSGLGLRGSLARALLGGGELGRVLALDQLDRSTGLLHRLARAPGHAGDLERQLGLELALAEQADAVLAAARQARRLERVMVERALGLELAGVDCLLHRADVHLGIIAREDVVEPALGQPHVERHLAALEAGDRHTRARLGALLAATGGLAEPRADAPADAHAALAGALVIPEIVEFHVPALAFAVVAQFPGEGRGPVLRKTAAGRRLLDPGLRRGAGKLRRLFHLDQVLHLLHLAEHFGRALDLDRTVKLVEPEPGQRRPLRLVAADVRAGLGDLDLRHDWLLRDRFGLGFGFGSTGAAAAEQVGDLLAAALRHGARARLILERLEGRADHVVGVGRADRLGHHVGDAETLEHRAHRTAGDNAGSGRSRTDRDAAGTEMAEAVVVQSAAVAQRNADHRLLGRRGRLADRLGNLAGLAVTEPGATLAVADDDQRRETEALAALHSLGDAVDVDELLDQLLAAVVVTATAATIIAPSATAAVAAAAPATAAARAA